MIKILALLFLIWIFFKALGQIFRTVLGGGPDINRGSRYGNTTHRQQQGDIHVDYDPNSRNKKGYQGGEYVDYEEVE